MLPSPKKANADADATYGTFPNDQRNAQVPLCEDQRRTSSPLTPPPASSTDPLLASNPKQASHPRRHPMLILLATPRMLAAILADLMQSIVLTGLETVLPLRIKVLFNYNSMQVALVFLILTIPSFFAPLVGLLSDKVGAKPVVSLGFLALAPLLILLRLVGHHSEAQVALLGSLLLLIGVALNMLATPAFTEATYVVDDGEAAEPGVFGPKGAYAQAFALMNIAYATGSLVGPFVGGSLAEWIGWDHLTLASGITCGLCALPCLYATGGRRAPVQASGEREPGS